MAVAPQLPRISRRRAAALLHGPIVSAAGWMGFDLVGRAPDDVDAPAIGPPASDAGSKVFVSVGEAAVVLFLKRVLG